MSEAPPPVPPYGSPPAPPYGGPQYGGPQHGAPQHGAPPDEAYLPPAARGRRGRRGPDLPAALLVLAFGVMVAGVFALPLNTYDAPGSDVGFVQVRNSAAIVSSRRLADTQLFSGLAAFWWHGGACIAAGVLLLAVCGAVLAASARALGWVIAVLAAAGGVLHGLAMAQSADFLSQQEFRSRNLSDFYGHSGPGVWVSLIGFGLLLVAGLVRALAPTRG